MQMSSCHKGRSQYALLRLRFRGISRCYIRVVFWSFFGEIGLTERCAAWLPPRQIVKSDPINDLTNHESRITRTHSAVGFRMHRQTLFNRVDQFLDIDWLDKKWMFVELEATL